MELRGQEERKGGRDYPALGVLILLLVALVVTGYLSFRSVAGGFDLGSDVSVRELIQGLEDKAKDWLERKTRFGKGKTDTARDHLVEGYRLYRKKRYARALEAFNKSVQMNETNPEAFYWRGRTLVSQGRFEPAVEDFQKAVNLRPDYAEAYDNLGWLYERLGETDKAVEALSRSIGLKPDNGWAYNQRGRNLFKQGDKEGALRDAKKACDLGFEEGCKAYERLKGGGGDSS